MKIRKIFQGMSSWAQLLFLFVFMTFGLILASFFSSIITLFFIESSDKPLDFMAAMNAALENPDFLRVSQFTQQILLFLIPAYLCAYLFHKNAGEYLKLDKFPDLKILLISVLLIFVIQPLISFTGYYNQQMGLPDALSGLEEWMKATEATNQRLIEVMLEGDSPLAFLASLFIIAIMPGLVEEFFFRGALQQIFRKIIGNYHWAVWIAAFIFSAIHMQFYGFIPRLLLGALLGYIFVWSRNLWIPIIIHFLNNALNVVLFKFYHGTPEYDKIENIGIEDSWWLTVISLGMTILLLVFMSKEYARKKIRNNEF